MSLEHVILVAVKKQGLQKSSMCLHTGKEQMWYGKSYQMTTELNLHKGTSQVGPQLARSGCFANGAS